MIAARVSKGEAYRGPTPGAEIPGRKDPGGRHEAQVLASLTSLDLCA